MKGSGADGWTCLISAPVSGLGPFPATSAPAGSRAGRRSAIIRRSHTREHAPMSDPKLRTVIDEIQSQLSNAQGLAPGQRRSLEELVRDLERLLEDPSAGEGATLRDRVTDSVRRLEASHPTLSTTLGNVVDTLAFFGL